jgi:selenoprotein W-related protein
LNEFEDDIDAMILIPSEGGRFEVSVNDRLIYSKLETNRHAEPGEVVELVSKLRREGK